MASSSLKFIDLFAGIGGFHLAFHRMGAECVFASEIDPHARLTYEHNFRKISPKLFSSGMYNDDITAVKNIKKEIPNFDILCAGFPCQPFSQAGFKRGFSEQKDKRGNMFFTIADIIAEKRPKVIFLENVRHLKNHDDGKTFKTIESIIQDDLGYNFYWKIVKASEHGLPQYRPRLFMVGFRKEDNYKTDFSFPEPIKLKMTMSDIWGGKCSRDIGYTLRVGGKGSGLDDRRNWDGYIVNGKERRLTSKQGKKMMGFPENFEFPVSETQALKQLGNSVAVNAIQATAESIFHYLETQQAKKKKVA